MRNQLAILRVGLTLLVEERLAPAKRRQLSRRLQLAEQALTELAH